MNAKRSVRRFFRAAAIASVALALGSTVAHAQKFEELFGGNCVERGNSGIRVSTGGYLSVGEYNSNSPSCSGNTDIYVVKLNNNGSLAWSKTFDIGGNGDWLADVVECSNGDFAITGTTDANSPCVSGSRQAFVLRISSTGTVVWVATYGTTTGCEWGYRIIEAANGTAPAAPGDLVVAGLADVGNTDGYLFRVSGANGTVVWSKKYGTVGSDVFYALTESSVGTGSGDIVAVGYSTGWSATGLQEGFIVRVNGNTGAIGLAPQGVATYGNGLGNVWLESVAELKVGSRAGELVYTGGNINSTSGFSDIYVLESAANPCTSVADAIYGDNGGTSHDIGEMIREVNLGGSSGLNNGDLILTGFSWLRGGNWGRSDAFLMELAPGTLALVTPGGIPAGVGLKLYGSGSIEEGWGVTPVAASASTTTAGFYITGAALYSNSATSNIVRPTDLAQMYVIKTDNLGRTNCHDTVYTPMTMTPALIPGCRSLSPITYGVKSSASTTNVTPSAIDTLCNDSLHPAPPPSDLTRRGDGGDDRGGATSSVTLTDESDANGSIRFYPNPVRRGDAIMIDLGVARSATTEIIVADLTGKVIVRERRGAQGGAVAVPTRDWNAGTYLVTVTSGAASRTERVVLLDK